MTQCTVLLGRSAWRKGRRECASVLRNVRRSSIGGGTSAQTITRLSSQTAASTRPGAGVRKGMEDAGRRGPGKDMIENKVRMLDA